MAKAHGRNLAYGVWQLHARDEADLIEISHGLEAAWRAGRVQLTASRGPGEADRLGPPPPPAQPPAQPPAPQPAPPTGELPHFAASQ